MEEKVLVNLNPAWHLALYTKKGYVKTFKSDPKHDPVERYLKPADVDKEEKPVKL